MNNYDSNEFNWSPANVMGGFLVILGAGVLVWVVVSLFQLFTTTSLFLTLDQIVPQEMVISESSNGKILLPREVLIFGVPIWALSVTTKIGIIFVKSGLEHIEKPRK